MSKTDLPILEQRRIEANVIKPLYREMENELGAERAMAILETAIVKNAINHGKAYADDQDTPTSLSGFAALMPQWTKGGALEIEVLQATDQVFDYKVTRCRYAEMYHEMGLGDIGHILSCARDGTFCQGYDAKISMQRTQTIMQGDSHCDFQYQYNDED
jgi:hypothetical protein